jgi:hypothetical protein
MPDDLDSLPDAEIDRILAQKLSGQEQVENDGLDDLSDSELDNILAQKMNSAAPANQGIQRNTEASMGPWNRLRYSVEPLESNRRALLQQEFGAGNVMEDKEGNLYLKQGNAYRPVNMEGFSFADVTDFAGALPENVGGLAAGLLGGAAATPATAGVGTIPAAMASGAAGAALGSAARQGMSAALGTPQVATGRERLVEAGLSGAFGAAGGGLGQGLKVGARAARPYFDDAVEFVTDKFKKAPQASQALDVATDVATDVKILPMADDVLEGPEAPREMIQEQMGRLQAIASRQGLPEPTYAQAAQGKALLAESKIIDTPLIGGKIRERVDGQIKAVRKNLEKQVGKFIDEDSSTPNVGMLARKSANEFNSETKALAQSLYKRVDELGQKAMVDKKQFFNKFRDYAAELGLVKPDLSPEQYAAETGLTRESFNALQRAMYDGLDAIKRTQSPKIRFEAVNAVRKTLNSTAEELRDKNPNAARLLKQFGKELDKTAEDVLASQHPRLGEIFKAANKTWSIHKDGDEFLKGLLPDNLGDEHVVRKIMSDTTNIQQMRALSGDKAVQEIGKSYVRDILSNLGKSGIGRADSALTAIQKSSSRIKAALGEKAYRNLVDNLYYLNKTGQPLTTSRQSLYNVIFDNPGGFKGAVARIATSAKTYVESKGGTERVAKSVARKSLEPINATFRRMGDVTPATNGGLSNLFLDESQREAAYFTRGPKRIAEDENKRKERRPARK